MIRKRKLRLAGIDVLRNLEWRPEDIKESAAAGNGDVFQGIRKALEGGHDAWIVQATDTGDILVVMGYKRQSDGTALVWAVATTKAIRYKQPLVKMAIKFVRGIRAKFKYGYNAVWAGNWVHVMFLRRLGATFCPPVEVNGHMFLAFRIGENYV